MLRLLPLLLIATVLSGCSTSNEASNQSPASNGHATKLADGVRKVEFTYTATLKEVPAGGQELNVWVPAPREEPGLQDIVGMDMKVTPETGAVAAAHTDPKSGNRWWHVRVQQPKAPLTFTQKITVLRREVRNNHFRGAGAKPLSPEEQVRFAEELGAYELVPVSGGKVSELATTIAPDEKNSLNLARKIYDYVLDSMRYSKDGQGWGRGDTNWACDSHFGNCTDFHSVFMSVAKARGIPVRFHMGFPLPEKRGEGVVGGYHCWAEFWVSEIGWVPVDISEADKDPKLAQYYFGNLTEDRIGFLIGRDLNLTPRPAAGKLNFIIYPYAELDGKPVTFERSFSYKDV